MSLFRKLFYDKSKNTYTADFAPSTPDSWPPEWITTFYKEYPRFDSVALPEEFGEDGQSLLSVLESRTSDRHFKGGSLPLKKIAELLKYSCGELAVDYNGEKVMHRPQPSGGGRYPVEMYAIVFVDSEELKAGVYHYNVKQHSLEYLWPGREYLADKSLLVIPDWAQKSSVLFVMTGVFWRTETKYRERGSAYTYLEAGHIAQNIHLLSQKLDLKSVGLGGVWDDSLEKILRLDTNIETPVHVIAVSD